MVLPFVPQKGGMMAPVLRIFRFGLFGCLVATSAVQSASAQELGAVRLDRAGTLARIYADTGSAPVEGRVQHLRADDMLVVRIATGAEVEVPRHTINRIEFSTGRRRHAWQGALIGAVAMGIPGAIYWSQECEGSCRLPGLEGFAIGALYYGVVPGFVIGSLIRTRSWRVLPLVYLDSAVERRILERVQLDVAPAPGAGVSLGLRITIG